MGEKREIFFDNPSNLTFDENFVEIVGDKIQLKDLGGGTYTTTPQRVDYLPTIKLSRIEEWDPILDLPANTDINWQMIVNSIPRSFFVKWMDVTLDFSNSNSLVAIQENLRSLVLGTPQDALFNFSFYLVSTSGTETPSI